MSATTTRGLGKGLSALMSETYSHSVAAEKGGKPGGGSVVNLSLAVLHAGAFQPRQQFGEEQLRELADSILKNGVMQPIVVRTSAAKKGMYEIVAGERRWRASKLAGLEAIPALMRDLSDQQALELAIVENIQRADLSPLEEAAGYLRLIQEFKYTQEELSVTVGKSRSHIANLIRLLELPDAVKAMLNGGQLTMGHARALIGAEGAVELAQKVLRDGLNVRQTEDMVRGLLPATTTVARPRKSAGQGAGSAHRQKDADILALEESLSENMGLKVSINDRGQQGEITLFYTNLGELDEILRRLGGSI